MDSGLAGNLLCREVWPCHHIYLEGMENLERSAGTYNWAREVLLLRYRGVMGMTNIVSGEGRVLSALSCEGDYVIDVRESSIH